MFEELQRSSKFNEELLQETSESYEDVCNLGASRGGNDNKLEDFT